MRTAASAEEISLDIGWGKLAGKAWGPRDGRPVLALHGWLDDAATFDPLIPMLGDKLRIVALDLPGHGLSDHRAPGATYHFIDYVTDVVAAAEALGWSRYALLGHSMGGGIASLLAPVMPDRVSALLLLEALGPASWAPEEAPVRMAHFLEEKKRAASKRLPVYADAAAANSIRQKAGDITLQSATILNSRNLRPHEGGLTWRYDPRLRLPSAHRASEAEVLAYLRAIRCPTLVIRAQAGLPAEEAIYTTRFAAVKGLRLEMVPGGHHVHLDEPARVAPLLRDFLDANPH